MKHRWLQYLALGCVVAAAACSNDDQQTAPNAPEMKVVPTTYPGCDFGTVKNLINSYFTSPNQLTAQGYESTMETGTPAVRVEYGFKIMDLIGSVSRSTTLSSAGATAGSNLTKALTKCMFDTSTPAYDSLHNGDGLDAIPFDSALRVAGGGVYYVVGAGFPSWNSKVLAGGIPSPAVASRKSAVGPGPATFATDTSTTFTLGSWTNVLAGNTYEGGTALVYGYPVSLSPIVYEWATIDPSTTFSPYTLISICDQSSNQSLMVHESNVGVLAYTNANLCGLPDATGTATKYKSHFQNTPVTAVSLAWVDRPLATLKLSKPDTVTVRVTDNGTGDGVNGACVTFSGSNNNGVPTSLVPGSSTPNNCDTPSSTKLARVTTSNSGGAAGYVTFIYSVTKSGGLVGTAALDEIIGRDQPTSNTLVAKQNVKP